MKNSSLPESQSLPVKTAYHIDPFFQSFLPVVSPSERQTLKNEAIADGGFRDPVVVWDEQSILLDGHTRHGIAEELGNIRPLEVVRKSFQSKADAARWVVNNQGARRNMTTAQIAFVLAENEELLLGVQNAAAERKKSGKKIDLRLRETKGTTNEKLAEQALGKTTAHAVKVVRALIAAPQTAYRDEIIRAVKANELSLRVGAAVAKKLTTDAQRHRDAAAAQKVKLPPAPQGSVVNSFILGDAIDGINAIENDSVTLTVTSPMYPLGDVGYPNWKYDGNYTGYLQKMEAVFAAVYLKTRDGGRCCINIVECSDQTGGPREKKSARKMLFVPGDFITLMERIGWTLRDTIIWYKQKFNGTRPAAGSSTAVNPRWQRSWEHVLIFHKGSSALEGDKLLEDLSPTEFRKWQDGFWHIAPADKRENKHRCPFPPELPRRLIKRLSRRGDIVLDCFSGSGTTCWVAAGLGRRWIGVDNAPTYIKLAQERMKQPYKEKKLKDPYKNLPPKVRVKKLVSFANRQEVEDQMAKMKKDAATKGEPK